MKKKKLIIIMKSTERPSVQRRQWKGDRSRREPCNHAASHSRTAAAFNSLLSFFSGQSRGAALPHRQNFTISRRALFNRVPLSSAPYSVFSLWLSSLCPRFADGLLLRFDWLTFFFLLRRCNVARSRYRFFSEHQQNVRHSIFTQRSP